MTTETTELLDALLRARLSAAQYQWMQERLSLLYSEDNLRHVHITFGLIPRRLGKQDLAVSPEENARADTIIPGWTLIDWSIDMTARILLLCTIARQTEHPFGELFKSMCQTADLGESIALYKGTVLFPPTEELDSQLGEGLRTSIGAVFEAIAHHNPYPAANFSRLRWNHMVLKALFVDSTLHKIQGLDERANPELARILCDYAHERWSAHRSVTPELWRCVGPFATDDMLDDLHRALSSKTVAEQQGAALALSQSPDPQAKTILATCPALAQSVANGELTWDAIDRSMFSSGS